jgi:hypothetical protein
LLRLFPYGRSTRDAGREVAQLLLAARMMLLRLRRVWGVAFLNLLSTLPPAHAQSSRSLPASGHRTAFGIRKFRALLRVQRQAGSDAEQKLFRQKQSQMLRRAPPSAREFLGRLLDAPESDRSLLAGRYLFGTAKTGEGLVGDVFHGFDLETGDEVALKRVTSVHLRDAFEQGGRYFIVTEWGGDTSAIPAASTRADMALSQFREAVKTSARIDLGKMPAGSQNIRRSKLAVSGLKVVERFTSHVPARRAVRRHNALFKLSHQIGAGELVLPAALDGETMITEHAGPGFHNGRQAETEHPEWFNLVSEKTKLQAAFLIYIAHAADQEVLSNVLINKSGDLGLIDVDFSFGEVMPWGYGKSMFFPGQKLGIKPGTQRSFSDLSYEQQNLVNHLIGQSAEEIGKEYAITLPEAQDLQDRCQVVKKYGLEEAIRRERFWNLVNGERKYRQ